MFTVRFIAPVVALLIASPGRADQSFPPPDWKPGPSPLAGEWAEPGGKLSEFLMQFPKSFNYLLDNNAGTRRIWMLMFDSLMGLDELTLEFEPELAERWTVSEDKLTITVHLDPAAAWSDGKPITAEDVVWTFEAVMKPENLTGVHKVGLDRFAAVTALDPRTVAFKAKEVHWMNLVSVASFDVLPKHWWEKQDFNRVNFEFPVVSGLYQLAEVNEPNFIRMRRRDDYWALDKPGLEGLYNFDMIEFRFYPERNLAFDSFKQREFDFFTVYTSHRWVEGARIDKVNKNWIVKQKVSNYNPVGFQGFAFNMRRDKFKDKRVRQAIAHCINRKEWNKTLMFNQYFLHRSYWEDLWSEGNPCPNVLREFDPDKARLLLDEAGWVTNPKTGFREKDGETFHINFLTRDPSSNKFVLPFKEVLKDVGISLSIDQKDWAAWTRDMDDYNFDMTWASWAATVFKNPEPSWHSKWVDTPSGNNITGFAHAKVDALIDGMKEEFDAEKRNDIVRKIDQILFEECPYALLWNRDYHRLLYWNRFGMPDHVLGKVGDEEGAKVYWWVHPDQEADLEAALADELPLPPRPAAVSFDDVFPPAAEPAQAPALR